MTSGKLPEGAVEAGHKAAVEQPAQGNDERAVAFVCRCFDAGLQAAYPAIVKEVEADIRNRSASEIESLRAEIQELEAVAVRRYTELNEAQRALKQAQETLSSPEKKNSITTNSETLEGGGR